MRARKRLSPIASAAAVSAPRPCARGSAYTATSTRLGLCATTARAVALMVAAIDATVPELATAAARLDRFQRMARKRSADPLAEWLEAAATRPLASFAPGIKTDEAAVAATLNEPWSNGQTEGRINRLKMLKRPMKGRAGLALLKARLIAVVRLKETGIRGDAGRTAPGPWRL